MNQSGPNPKQPSYIWAVGRRLEPVLICCALEDLFWQLVSLKSTSGFILHRDGPDNDDPSSSFFVNSADDPKANLEAAASKTSSGDARVPSGCLVKSYLSPFVPRGDMLLDKLFDRLERQRKVCDV